MKIYPLKVAKSKKLFDILSLDKLLVSGISIFFIAIVLGILHFGPTNTIDTYVIVLTTYALFLGSFLTSLVYKKQLDARKDFPHLLLLADHHSHTELVIDADTKVVRYQNKTFGQSHFYTELSILLFIESLELHAIDKGKIIAFFDEKKHASFFTVVQKKEMNGQSSWFSIEIKPLEKKGKSFFILKILDITQEQKNTRTQQQYIRDMEHIIQQYQQPTPSLDLIGQMAAVRNIHRPLQTMQAYIQLIEDNYKKQLDKKGQSVVEAIAKENYQLTTLVEDMYTLAGLDMEGTGDSKTDLNHVLASVLERLDDKIQTSDAQIKYPKLPIIKADYNQLLLLFQNLIENALIYCGSQPPVVSLDWYQNETHWIFRVSDQGMGISRKFKEDIFNILNRGQIKTGIKGVGLGLSICKQIVDNHKGEIWVESAGPGKGCTFAFTIPMEQKETIEYKRERMMQPMAVSA